MMDELDLQDVWRYHNPNNTKFTFHRANQASRLDYLLTSSHMVDACRGTEITPIALSDHALISLSLNTAEVRRGPGIWRFESTLLQDDQYVLSMIDTLKSLTSEHTIEDPVTRWEWIKYNIRKETSTYETKLRQGYRQEEKTLSNLLLELTSKKDKGEAVSEEELVSVKRELSELELSRAQGTILRARANWSRYGEKSSRYFLNLQKRKSKDKVISSLITDDNTEITNIKEILEYERSYFQSLYTQSTEAPEIPYEV